MREDLSSLIMRHHFSQRSTFEQSDPKKVQSQARSRLETLCSLINHQFLFKPQKMARWVQFLWLEVYMERNEFKWIAGIAVVFILILFTFLQPLRTDKRGMNLDEWLTVSMPRPIKEMILGFSLEGRSVRRELEMVVSAQKLTAPAMVKKDSKAATQAAVDKGAQKKKQERLAKAKQAEERFQKALQERAFRMRVVQEAERYRKSLYAQMQREAYRQVEEAGGGRIKNNIPASDVPDKKEEDHMTASAWRNLVFSQPSRDNIEKMVQAYHEGKIDEDAFYDIVAALIKDNSIEKQKMGVWALTSSASFQGFSMAAHMAATESNAAEKKVLTDYMYNYNRVQTLGYLDQALRSADPVVSAAAAQAITQAVDKLKAGQQLSGQGRGSRTDQQQQSTLSLTTYKRFVPTLQWLVSSTNSLSQWAQSLLSQLQSNTSPA